MPTAIQIPVRQTGLEKSIQDAMNRAGKGAHINLGHGARQINALSQPLGKITGQADQFTKSMEAANARVFAFGASVGILGAVANAFKKLLVNTIEVEKTLTDINSVFQKTTKEMEAFGAGIFDVARNTGQSFKTVAEGALELSRQGLSAEESLKRVNDAMILSRLSGLDAAKSVEGLTAAINSFSSVGLTSSEIMNKMVAVAQKYAVSERDLIEGVKRSAAVANQAGVSFDELLGIITAVQERTARGGAVIGNAFKTIFSRIQNKDTLMLLQDLGVQVSTLEGDLLPATKIIKNLSTEFKNLSQVEQMDLAKKLGGIYQLSNLLAIVEDYGDKSSVAISGTKDSMNAANQAYERNAALNKTLSALINEVSVSYEQLTSTLGKIGLSDGLKQVIAALSDAFGWIQRILDEDSAMGAFAKTMIKGIGGLLLPGLGLAAAVIAKLMFNLVKFGSESFRSFFNLNKSAKELQSVERSINVALASNLQLQKEIYNLEGNRLAQAQRMASAIGSQEAEQRRLSTTAARLAGPLYMSGVRATSGDLRAPNAAGGLLPAQAQEASSIAKGVGGARVGDRPVVIPNFSFGGGKRGTVVAHTGEYMVPNFAGTGGSAIFNRDMVKQMGLPIGAKKINAAGGYIPNFAKTDAEWLRTAEKSASGMASAFTNRPDLVKAHFPAEFEARMAAKASGKYASTVNIEAAKEEKNKAIAAFPTINGIQKYGLLAAALVGSSTRDLYASANGKISETPAKDSAFKLRFPIAGVKERELTASYYNKQSRSGVEAAIRHQEEVRGDKFTIKEKKKFLQGLNKGSFGAIGGTIAENVLRTMAGIDVQASGKRIDLPLTNRLRALTTGFPASVREVEVKGSLKRDNILDMGRKLFSSRGESDMISANAAGGFIPNFIRKERLIGRGAFGAFYRLNDDVGTKKFHTGYGDPTFDIIEEYANAKLISEVPLVAGITGPRVLNTLEDAIRAKRIRKEIVKWPTASKSLGHREGENVGRVLTTVLSAAGIRATDLHGSNYSLNPNAVSYFNSNDEHPMLGRGQSNYWMAEFARNGGMASIFDAGFMTPTNTSTKSFVANIANQAERLLGINYNDAKNERDELLEQGSSSNKSSSKKYKPESTRRWPSSWAGGYIPSFASPNAIDAMRRIINDPAASAGEKANAARFLSKFGATASGKPLTGQRISLRQVFDALDGSDGISQIIDAAYTAAGPTASSQSVFQKFSEQISANPQRLRDLVKAKGFVPNFANPLSKAIKREMDAGVPASKIYVDQSPVLRNPSNPMGLMVANRIDEPMGGHQGIRRAIKEGKNPKIYGAADGLVPNFAQLPLNQAVSGETGISISKNSRVDKAINGLATKAFTTGEDLDKLSKELKKYLISIGASNEDAKKVSEATKQEVKKRMELVATKALESEAGKKAARQLDRVYTKYNRSEKTAGDLAKAQVNATQILNRSSLSVPAKNAIISSTQTLSANRTSAQPAGPRDMLGTIFALQGAFSMLSSATGDATKGVDLFFNSMSAVASKTTTALMAIQAGTGMFQNATNKTAQSIGGFLGKFGVYGALAVGAFAAVGEVGKAIDKSSGIYDTAAKSLNIMSNAASRAAVTLDQLDPEAKRRTEKLGESLFNNLTTGAPTFGDRVWETMGLLGGGSTNTAQEKLNTARGPSLQFTFEGNTDALENSTKEIITKALGMGLSFDAVKNTFNDLAKDGKMSQKDVENFSKSLSAMVPDKVVLDKALESLTSVPDSDVTEFFLNNSNASLSNPMMWRNTAEGSVQRKIAETVWGVAPKMDMGSDPMLKYFSDLGTKIKEADASESGRDEFIKRNSISISRQKQEFPIKRQIQSFAQDFAFKSINSQAEQMKKMHKISLDLSLSEDERLMASKRLETSFDIRAKNLEKESNLSKTISEESMEISRRLRGDIKSQKEVFDVIRPFVQSRAKNIDRYSSMSPDELYKNITSDFKRNGGNLSGSPEFQNAVAESMMRLVMEQQEINRLQSNEELQKKRLLKIELDNLATTRARKREEDSINKSLEYKLKFESSRNDLAFKRETLGMDTRREMELLNLERGGSADQGEFLAKQQEINNRYLALQEEAEKRKAIRDLDLELKRELYTLENIQALQLNTDAIKEAPNKLQEMWDKAKSWLQEKAKSWLQEKAPWMFKKDEVSKDTMATGASSTYKADERGLMELFNSIYPSYAADSSLAPDNARNVALKHASELSIDPDLKNRLSTLMANQYLGRSSIEEDFGLRAEDRNQKKALEDMKNAPQTFRQGINKGMQDISSEMRDFEYNLAVSIPKKFSDAMTEGLMKVVDGTDDLKSAFMSIAYDFVREMNRNLMSNMMNNMVHSFRPQSSTGPEGAGLSAVKSIFDWLPFGNKHASGGIINGGSGTKDDVPALLTGGEFVIKKSAVQKYGPSFLNAVNNQTLGGYAKGGMAQKGPRTNFYMPGTYGQGDIVGMKDLLGYASQGYTNPSKDIVRKNFIKLAPESVALTNKARMSREGMIGMNREAKQSAFSLFVQEMKSIQEAKKQAKQQKTALYRQLGMMALMAGAGAAATGFGNAWTGAGNVGFGTKLMAGTKGMWGGYEGIGGLGAIFSKNPSMAWTQYAGRANVVGGVNGAPFGLPSAGGLNSSASRVGSKPYSSSFENFDIIQSQQGTQMLDDFSRFNFLATGGQIKKSSGVDTIPAMLSGGEFIMNRAASQAIGSGNLTALNSGASSMVTEEVSEKLNEKLLAKLDELIDKASGSNNITINVDGNGRSSTSASGGASQGGQQLARQIKDVVLQILQDQKRLGGTLRRA